MQTETSTWVNNAFASLAPELYVIYQSLGCTLKRTRREDAFERELQESPV